MAGTSVHTIMHIVADMHMSRVQIHRCAVNLTTGGMQNRTVCTIHISIVGASTLVLAILNIKFLELRTLRDRGSSGRECELVGDLLQRGGCGGGKMLKQKALYVLQESVSHIVASSTVLLVEDIHGRADGGTLGRRGNIRGLHRGQRAGSGAGGRVGVDISHIHAVDGAINTATAVHRLVGGMNPAG